jgi:hypothetical protein
MHCGDARERVDRGVTSFGPVEAPDEQNQALIAPIGTPFLGWSNRTYGIGNDRRMIQGQAVVLAGSAQNVQARSGDSGGTSEGSTFVVHSLRESRLGGVSTLQWPDEKPGAV